ncbi:MAG TPA: beta-ketoacyl synthase N-terminal-like domain-containing protein, partial [Thermoanaerobaculia bacterium]|nr:beta-ketoacyl synthase N-terminal-like domain-containing protein [Thermoanaerobaculia bacterium]
LWQAGGMGIDPSSQELLQQATGMQPMQTATGLRAFYRSLALPYDRTMVLEGDLEQMRAALLAGRPTQAQTPLPSRPPAPADANGLGEDTEEYLRQQLSALLKMPSSRIDPQAPLEKYGIDSILAMKLTSQLEKTFGTLSKTLFFEYQSIRELSGYFVQSHAATLTALFADRHIEPIAAAAPAQSKRISRRVSTRTRSVAATTTAPASDQIAIIGLSGRYPEAFDIGAYWRNLRDGKDCIIEVPKERWAWQTHFSDDRTKEGQHYSKWGGFIAGVDEFDPLFFNISPKDAKLIDPQERLFLQHAWMAMEDAGYTRAGLQVPYERDLAGQVGVYVGVMYNEYQLFGAESSAQGKPLGIAGSVASIANRVSYVLNLHGPSMTLDTMCSSSLTAIHIACQDLKQGRTSLAIAGGVNVTIHPNKYLVLSAGQFISSDGHCQSFGEGGDGYIPGEGVGVVVLKRLSEAERDGDHIYGVIRGSALTHGGKTNGYTVPNPQAQTSAIGRALAETGTDARHISYVEAHGTGTKLGDPIEIAALNKAFHHYTEDAAFCRIGSAKSNIGHCESAAGIAGLTKVLLQMQHRQIVPSLHSAALNPHIDFDSTPFVVNQALTTWERPVVDGHELPRIAGISSFGAGGSNAHMIVEEYQPPEIKPMAAGKVVILLSARTAEQLRQKARELLAFVRERADTIDLTAMSYTLQLGREPMEERLGLIVTTVDQMLTKLESYVAGEPAIEDAYQGQVKRNREALSVFTADADLQQTIDKWIAGRKLPKLLDLWVKGLDVDWSGLYGDSKPPRISLPTYPFARERYWIDMTPVARVVVQSAAAVIHPLLHQNTSDLNQQSYSSTFSGDEFFLNDTSNGSRILPAAAYLEMARAAIAKASAGSQEMLIELRDVVWGESLVFDQAKQVNIALLPRDAHQIDYEIYSRDSDEEVIHCQGRAVLSVRSEAAAIDIKQLERNGELLVRLHAPESAEETWGDYVLHPSMLDGALQAAGSRAQLPARIETLRIVAPCSKEMVAWVRHASDKVDIDLCDARGNVAAQIRGMTWRPAPVSVVVPAAPPVMTEIVLPQATTTRRGVALTAPNARATAAGPSTGRPAITLSKARRGPADQSNLPRGASSVRLYDSGNGIFSIQIAERDSIADLLQALELVQQNASVKVLILAGLERCFARGGREDYNEAVDRHLFSSLAAFSYPVIAVLQGDANGAGIMAAALCDFMVCNEDASYGYSDAPRHFYPTIPELRVFTERFGDLLAQDFLYGSSASTGKQLRARGWTCPIVPSAQVETFAQQLASTLATKSQDALRLLK